MNLLFIIRKVIYQGYFVALLAFGRRDVARTQIEFGRIVKKHYYDYIHSSILACVRSGLGKAMSRMTTTLEEHDVEQLTNFLEPFRSVFARADQAQSFELYVRGLLHREGRKNVESIAERTPETVGDLSQALQHFVTTSPWNGGDLISRHLTQLSRFQESVWIVHDGCIPKKGRHSVGVQRQFARDTGKKANCQIAVVVTEVGRTATPLSTQLYLPASWLREHEERAVQTIPDEYRQPRSKAEIALALIDGIRPYRSPKPIFADDGYATSAAFIDGLAARGLQWQPNSQEPLLAAQSQFDWLRDVVGLGHFEGRTWNEWHHHAALVLVAAGYLIREKSRESR